MTYLKVRVEFPQLCPTAVRRHVLTCLKLAPKSFLKKKTHRSLCAFERERKKRQPHQNFTEQCFILNKTIFDP